MRLAVNIGNSNIRFAIASGTEVHFSWTIHTKPYKTAGEFFLLFENFKKQYQAEIAQIQEIVIGSVVPLQTSVVSKVLENGLSIKPLVVSRETPSVVTHSSNQMGTDLYANAVAAHYLYPRGKKIIIDYGTALTLTAIDAEGKVLGVIIAPGVMTSLNALVGNTAQLTDVEVAKPKSLLGSDTVTCMQSGLLYGYAEMVEGLIRRIKKEAEYDFLVISTGGLGHIYKEHTPSVDVDDKLHTIKGLCVLADIASSSANKK